MKTLTYTIHDEAGIHARPAGILVKAMQGFESEIMLTRGEKTVSLKKLFALMGLAIKQNQTITITFDGVDEEIAMNTAQKVLEAEGL
jgi:phosphocarrier protein